MPLYVEYPYFALYELESVDTRIDGKPGTGWHEMDPRFMGRLVRMRQDLDEPLILTSAYRTPQHNDRVSSTGEAGPHTTGRAVDIKCSHGLALTIIQVSADYGFTGIGVKQHGTATVRFIHLDDLLDHETAGPRPTIWSYP